MAQSPQSPDLLYEASEADYLPPLPPGTPLSPDCPHFSRFNIFISIASYRDPQTFPTVVDALRQAAHPERLKFGIFWQLEDNEDDSLRFPPDWAENVFRQLESSRDPAWPPLKVGWSAEDLFHQVQHREIPAEQARGPVAARHEAEKLFHGEEFFLQIDSHMRFSPQWENFLLFSLYATKKIPIQKRLKEIDEKYDPERKRPWKPILTGYPRDFSLSKPLDYRENSPTVLCASHFDGQDGLLRICGKILTKSPNTSPSIGNSYFPLPFPSLFIAAGFLFSPSQILKEIPTIEGKEIFPDLFFGEEFFLLSRLFSYGWNFYSPGVNILWHLWNRSERGKRTYREYSNIQKELEKKNSQERLMSLYQGENFPIVSSSSFLSSSSSSTDFPLYFGQDRSLSDFSYYLGFSFPTIEIAKTLNHSSFTDYSLYGGLDSPEERKLFLKDRQEHQLSLLLGLVEKYGGGKP